MNQQQQNIELFSVDEEKTVLGNIMHDPSNYDAAALQDSDFYLDRHKYVWQALTKLIRDGRAVDFILVGEELKSMGLLDDIGGIAYLGGLLLEPLIGNIAAHAETLKIYSRRRSIKAAAEQLLNIAYIQDVKELESGAARLAEGLLSGASVSRQSRHWKAGLESTMTKIEERSKNPQEVWGIMSGLTEFDAYTGGAMYGKTCFVTGASGIGKSILTYQLGLSHLIPQVQGAKTAKGLGIYTLEMDEIDVDYRMLSALAKVPTLRLLSGYVQDTDWPALAYAMEMGARLPVYVNDSPGLTLYEFEADLRRLKYLYGVDTAVLDYMYIVEADVPRGEDRTEYLSRNIRRIARQLGVILYVVNSAIKSGDEDEVNLRDMRGSGQVGNEADTIVAVLNHQPENGGYKQPNIRTLKFLKGRHMPGSKPIIHLELNANYPWFYDVKARTTKL